MGYLVNGAPVVTESNAMTLSTWVRIPATEAANTYAGFVHWGLESTAHINAKVNYIGLTKSGGNWRLTGSITGAGRERAPPGDTTNVADNIGIFATPATISVGSWYHFLVAISAGGNLNSYGVDGGQVGTAVINASVQDSFSIVANTGPLSNILNFATELTGNGLRMYGKPCGVPWVIVGNDSQSRNQSQSRIDMADFQLWYGLYIDPTNASNFSKFVTITGNVGRPASTLGAANAFGEPHILFSGKASNRSFYINRGTGGEFTLTGSGTDTTGPSYTA